SRQSESPVPSPSPQSQSPVPVPSPSPQSQTPSPQSSPQSQSQVSSSRQSVPVASQSGIPTGDLDWKLGLWIDDSDWRLRLETDDLRLTTRGAMIRAMPELPEVEAVRGLLDRAMRGARIVRVQLRRGDLRRPFPRDFVSRLEGTTVESVGRRGKYLLIAL